MNQQVVEFDGNSILKLLTHYTEGGLPLDSKLVSAGVSVFFDQWLGLVVESEEWEGKVDPTTGELPDLHIRYEGKKVMCWTKGPTKAEWGERGHVEAPKRR